MSTAKAIAAAARAASSIVLIPHQNPDGDAIGSAVALMRGLGDKSVRIACASPLASVFTEVLGPVEIESSLPVNANLYIVLDCPDIRRTGFGNELLKLAKKKLVAVIDHHQKGDMATIANYYLFSREVSSTCQLVAKVLEELRQPLDRAIASALLMGIYTDTGGFQHPNTSSETLSLAAKLIRQGADFGQISSLFAPKREPRKLRLWGQILGSVSINSLGIAVARVSRITLKELKASETDLSGLAKYLCSTEGTKAALVLVETDRGWRGSLRTHSRTFNVGRLAKLLGGSGGRKVAGFLATETAVSGTMVGHSRVVQAKELVADE